MPIAFSDLVSHLEGNLSAPVLQRKLFKTDLITTSGILSPRKANFSENSSHCQRLYKGKNVGDFIYLFI